MGSVLDFKMGKIIESTQPNTCKYKVIKRLGSGGNGTAFLVYCIEDKFKGSFFTLKVLKEIENAERTERFLEEIKFLREHSYPSIVSHYDEGKFIYKGKEFPFVVTHYFRNTLSEKIPNMNMQDALVFSVQLLSAIDYLQKNEILHRDIKPENIFVENSKVVLSDFGLLKKRGAESKALKASDVDYIRNAMPNNYRTPQLVSYMKNEVDEISMKSDIFQLGLVFHEMFTGYNPLKQPPKKDHPIDEKAFQFRQIKSLTFGSRINGLILKMLSLEEENIPSSSELLRDFQSIMIEYMIEKDKIDLKMTF